MRIKEGIKKNGYFWLPSKPESKIPGILSISDGGIIELEIFGMFNLNIKSVMIGFNDEDTFKEFRLNGEVENIGGITLDKCLYRTQSFSFGGVGTSIVTVGQIFFGVYFDEGEELLFNNFRFSLDYLDDWVDTSGIKVEYYENSANATYIPIETIITPLKNDISIGLIYTWSLPGWPNITEAKFTQKVYLELNSENLLPLKEFVILVNKINTFINFAIGESVSIDEVILKRKDLYREDENDLIPVGFYHKSSGFVEKTSQINKRDMLFLYPFINENFGKILNNWLNAYEIFEPSLNLYFSTKMNGQKYIDGKFLALIQGLETLHRRSSSETFMDEEKFKEMIENILINCPEENKEWLQGRLKYGNEIGLSKRLRTLIKPFNSIIGNSYSREKLISKIVDTRNYLTHYDIALVEKSAKGVQMWILCKKMELIFQLHILKILDFSKEEIETIVEKNKNLNYNRNL